MSDSKIKILLVDDHQIFLDGLQLLLGLNPVFEIVATAQNGALALEALKENEIDVVITDINMPEVDGIELIRKSNTEHSAVKFIALTMLNDYASVFETLEAGADGYLLKNTSAQELNQAISDVLDNKSYVSPGINLIVVEKLKEKNKTYPELSPREIEVLSFIVKGLSSRQIAEEIHLSIDTIKFHRKNLLSKLNQPNSAALVSFAIENKIV